MRILTAAQLKKVDQETITSEPIASIDLMERAAFACTNWLSNHYPTNQKIGIVCGKGNNGGDGLAIARQLLSIGYQVDVFVLNHTESSSNEFNTNLAKLDRVTEIERDDAIVDINDYTLLIDCIFGSGLNRPIEGFISNIIEQINSFKGDVVSIDMPSGLYCGDNSSNTGTIVECTTCLTLELPKLALLLPENQKALSQMVILTIGLDHAIITVQPTDYFYVDDLMAALLHRQRQKFAHKGHFGHAMIIAGSTGKMGAAVLATKACLRAGAGLVTSCIPISGSHILQSATPEAMVITGTDPNHLCGPIDAKEYTVGIGPGIGLNPATAEFMQALLKDASKPMVIDADALNILSENKSWIRLIPDYSILTPHPKELERLIGEWKNDFDKLARVKLFCKNNQCFMVIKGAHTAIVDPLNNIYFNSTGNPGLATGGSGDVLTGIITGLLAQGYTPLNASLLGVYLHGLAGDLAAKTLSQDAMIASDIIEHLGVAFQLLKANEATN